MISIILPVYNGESYLESAIQSCLEQTYKNFELIIVNDASTDNSLKIAKSFQKKDERLKIISNIKNRGLPTSLNIGHQKAMGKFYTWTSDDNLLKPEFLDSLYSNLRQRNCDIIFSNFDVIDKSGEIIRKHLSGPVSKLLFGNYIGASFMYKRTVYEALNGFNEELFLVEDHDFFLRAALYFKFCHLNKNLFAYRQHSESLTNRIHNDPLVYKRYIMALENMYNGLNIHSATQKVLIGLLLNKPILRQFIENRKVILEDIEIFQSKLEMAKVIRHHLEYSLRLNWLKFKADYSFKTLMHVLLKSPELLINGKHNRNASLRIIYNSLK